jgi:hypothetical protein
MADEIKIASGDARLLRAAAGDPTELVQLTPELVKEIVAGLKDRQADIAARYPKLVADCPYETRLAVAAWVFQHIVAHARERGTFRYLIYDRLGFRNDAYLPLYTAGGMTISNEFDLTDDIPKGSSDVPGA